MRYTFPMSINEKSTNPKDPNTSERDIFDGLPHGWTEQDQTGAHIRVFTHGWMRQLTDAEWTWLRDHPINF
jgi:hypothetical protein